MWFYLIRAVIGLVLILLSYYALFTPKGRDKFEWFLKNFIGATLAVAGPIATTFSSSLLEIVNAFVTAISSSGGPLKAALTEPFKQVASATFDSVSGDLTSGGVVKPEDWPARARSAMETAYSTGLAASGVAAAFEALFPERLNVLNGIAPMMGTMSGFEEVTAAWLRPTLRAAIGQPAQYDANARTRSLLPDQGRALEMFARRVITAAQRDQLMAYAGMNPDWVGRVNEIAYRPLSPFIIAAGFQNADIDEAALRSAFEYMGTRPPDVPLGIKAIETRALAGVRTQYVAEAMSAYAAGVVGDDELDSIFADAGWGKEASALAKKRALIARRVTLAKEVETQVGQLVAVGAMTPDEGTHQLTAAGLQPWQVNLKIELATTKAAVARAKATATAEKKLELKRQSKSAELAVANFRSGITDAAGLAAELFAAGIDPAIVATTVAAQEAIRAGRLKLVYGQLLSPQKAKILTEQVAAVESQLKKQLISDQQALSNLEVLNVDALERQALLSRWMAEKAAATKTGEFLTP